MAGSSVAIAHDERVSLLWPPGRTSRPGAGLGLPVATRADLDLDEIVQALSGGEGRRERYVNAILADLVTDATVINYRQDVMDDLRPDEVLCQRLREVQPGLASLGLERGHTVREQWSVLQIARRLAYLELYVHVALQLQATLEAADLRSAGLTGVRDHLRRLAATEEFQSLRQELPDMRRQLDQAGSITVGINLSRDLTPESATIMSVSAQKLEGRGTFLERLLGSDPDGRGLTPVEIVDGVGAGKGLDMLEAGPVLGFDTHIEGTTDPAALRGADLVIVTSGMPRKPGMSRTDLLNANADIVRQNAAHLVKYTPDAIVTAGRRREHLCAGEPRLP